MSGSSRYLVSFTDKNLKLYREYLRTREEYFRSIKGSLFDGGPGELVENMRLAYNAASKVWGDALNNMRPTEKLPVLLSHVPNDDASCELAKLFVAEEEHLILVKDNNIIQAMSDAWEASDSNRFESSGRGKGTVVSWLLNRRGEKVALSSIVDPALALPPDLY